MESYLELAPITISLSREIVLRKKLESFFRTEIFRKLIKSLPKEKGVIGKIALNSAQTALIKAVLNGTINFANNSFFGSFSGSVSKELKTLGASYDKKTKRFRIAFIDLPIKYQQAIGQSSINAKALRTQALAAFDTFSYEESFKDLDFSKSFDGMGAEFDKKFKRSIKDLSLAATFTDEQRAIISKEYSENLKLDVKKFIDKEIIKMRELVEENWKEGRRTNQLEKIIKDRFGVSTRKAKFLAEQETSLLSAKYRETRYKDIGVDSYVWSSSLDGSVRDDHADLHGKVFRFDDPPVVNKKTGKRANAGEDYGCRCKAKPLVLKR